MFETYETKTKGNGALTSDVKITRSNGSRLEQTNLEDPGFGINFTDHMLSMVYGKSRKWYLMIPSKFLLPC